MMLSRALGTRRAPAPRLLPGRWNAALLLLALEQLVLCDYTTAIITGLAPGGWTARALAWARAAIPTGRA
eukprot:5057032-Pleurochrysis_carterae.AAC.1